MKTEQPITESLKSVAQRVGVSPQTIMRRVKAGEFPAPIWTARPRWPVGAVEQWIRQHGVDRDQHE